MEYIVLKEITILALCTMGECITIDCEAETQADCLVCPKQRQCAFLSATINALEKGEEV